MIGEEGWEKGREEGWAGNYGMVWELHWYCRTNQNCNCPGNLHYCPSYALAEKCPAPPLVASRRYKPSVDDRPSQSRYARVLLRPSRSRTLHFLASNWPKASKTGSVVD
jgi:hypothetical protein